MPYLYFLFLLFFLLLFAIFLTAQLYTIFKFELFARSKMFMQIEKLDLDQFFYVIKYCSYKKFWFQCLNLLEKQVQIPLTQRHKYFNVVGFIYYKMAQYYLAELYYKVSLSYKPDYTKALKNLSKIEEMKK